MDNNFVIDNDYINSAQEICRFIDNNFVRNRAVANVFAAKIAKEFFSELEIDCSTGLHNIYKVLEIYDISDVYVKNNYIDIRVYTDENELCVPKIHFDYGILPVTYMFIKLDEGLTTGTVTGFLPPENINTENEFNGYYPIQESELVSFYDVEPLIVHNEYQDINSDFDIDIFDFLDGKLENIQGFISQLIFSEDARIKLLNATKTQTIFNFVSVTTEEFQNNQTTSNEDEESDSEPFLLETEPEGLEFFENDTFEEIDNNETLELDEQSNLIEEFEDVNSLEFEDGGEITNLEELQTEDVSDDTFIEDTVKEEEDDDDNDVVVEPEEHIENNLEENNTIVNETSVEENNAMETEENDIITENLTTEASIDDVQNVYSTATTPSIATIEDEVDDEYQELSKALEEDKRESITSEAKSIYNDENKEIEALFNREEYTEHESGSNSEYISEDDATKYQAIGYTQSKKSSFLPFVGTLAVLGALGYYGYTKYFAQGTTPLPPAKKISTTQKTVTKKQAPVKEAMPNETIENSKEAITDLNEGNNISIPAIEQNLDASILISNLNVNWEVPVGYVNNNTAKRYFAKMGKIIQLHLKTELLMLSKPPITNRISVELQFSPDSSSFYVVGVLDSSGEKVVDNLIVDTIKKALDINLKMNLSSFASIQGNPILVINL